MINNFIPRHLYSYFIPNFQIRYYLNKKSTYRGTIMFHVLLCVLFFLSSMNLIIIVDLTKYYTFFQTIVSPQ